MPRARQLLALECLSFVLAGCGGGEPAEPDPREGLGRDPGGGRPNIVVVMTDDQAEERWQDWLPATAEEMAGQGAVFTNSFVTTPLCCPSRASFLTGQYAHNHGIVENAPGYPALRDPGSLLPRWLQRAGYETAHVGKWLHGYELMPDTQEGTLPPPGWDEWDALLSARYYDYSLSVNGTLEQFGHEASDHANAVVTRYGLRFLRSAAVGGRPFFLSLAYIAPHSDNAQPLAGGTCGDAGEAVPAPADLEAVESLTELPGSEAVNEEDVSDKPGYVRDLPKLSATQLDLAALAVGCQRASLRSVDRGVEAILKRLRRGGALEDTLVVFTSDNGYLNGEHRFNHGKSVPFDESVRVPLAIRPPGGVDPVEIGAVAANIDLAPTLLDYAGAKPCTGDGECRTLDGRSLRPLIEGSKPAWAADRTILTESAKRTQGSCRWTAVRTASLSYAHHVVSAEGGGCGGNEAELYDLAADPDELENLARDPDHLETRSALAAEMKKLADCAGEGCW